MGKWPEMQQGKAGNAWEMSQAVVEARNVVLPVLRLRGGGWLQPLARWRDQADNDPVVFLTYLMLALQRVEPVDAGILALLVEDSDAIRESLVERDTSPCSMDQTMKP